MDSPLGSCGFCFDLLFVFLLFLWLLWIFFFFFFQRGERFVDFFFQRGAKEEEEERLAFWLSHVELECLKLEFQVNFR